MDISEVKAGQKLVTADGKTVLEVQKVTNGQLIPMRGHNATCKGYHYCTLQKGEPVRELKTGNVLLEFSREPVWEKGRKLVEVLPDTEDKFVWWKDEYGSSFCSAHEDFFKVWEVTKTEVDKGLQLKKAHDSDFVKDVAKEILSEAASGVKDSESVEILPHRGRPKKIR